MKLKSLFLRYKDKIFRFLTFFMSVLVLMSCFALPAAADNVVSTSSVFTMVTRDEARSQLIPIDVFSRDQLLITGSSTRSSFDAYVSTHSGYWWLPAPRYVNGGERVTLTGYIYVTVDTIKVYLRDSNSYVSLPYTNIGADGSNVTWYRYFINLNFVVQETTTDFGVAIQTTGTNMRVGSLYMSIDDTNLVVNSINTGVADILEDNAAQTSEIKAILQSGANQVSSSIDSQTDTITNGGTDYGSVDKSQSNEYIAQEEVLNASTSQSRENTVSLFSGFGSFFLNSKLAKGLTGCTKIMTDFLQINWLSDMVNFVLILGAFAFVIGAGFMLGGIHKGNVRAADRKQRRKGG